MLKFHECTSRACGVILTTPFRGLYVFSTIRNQWVICIKCSCTETSYAFWFREREKKMGSRRKMWYETYAGRRQTSIAHPRPPRGLHTAWCYANNHHLSISFIEDGFDVKGLHKLPQASRLVANQRYSVIDENKLDFWLWRTMTSSQNSIKFQKIVTEC